MTAFSHGTVGRFYYHGLDYSDYAEQVGAQFDKALAEYRPLSARSVQRVAGHRDLSLSLSGGALDTSAGANDADAWARLGEDTGRVFAYLPGGDALGRAAYCGVALGQNQQRVVGDDIIRLPVALVSADEFDRAVVLRALAAGGISPASSVDGGASSSGGAMAYLICTALDGTSLAVTIEDSANNVDWDTLLTMTTLTAVGSEAKAVSGFVNRYVRVSWTLTGTAATWWLAFGRR